MRRLVLALCLLLTGTLALSASAAKPRLGPADVAAVRSISSAADGLARRLKPKLQTSLIATTTSFGRCASKYAKESQEHQQLVAMHMLMIAFLQAIQDGLPLYDAFTARVARTKVTHPLLKAARQATSVERAEAAKIAKIGRLDVCAEVAKLADSGYSTTYSEAWFSRLQKRVGASDAAGTRADRAIHASRPALLAAGLSAAKAKALMDAETGDVFASLMGTK